MFSSTGCFSKITCPLNNECALLNCIFLHTENLAQRAWLHMGGEDAQEQPPVKRQKLNTSHWPVTGTNHISVPPRHKSVFVGALTYKPLTPPADLSDGELDEDDQHGAVEAGEEDVQVSHLVRRSISPPPLRRERQIGVQHASESQKHPVNGSSSNGRSLSGVQESLNPRKLIHDPAGHQSRVLYLQKLHEYMALLNEAMAASQDADTRALTLTKNDLIKMALDEEEKIACESPTVYANVIKLRMVAYKKMSLEQWKLARLEANAKAEANIEASRLSNPNIAQVTISPHRPLDTGLSTAQEIELLPHLFAKQEGLEPFGFVTAPPTDHAIAKAKEGVAASHGWEQCERCKTRFQVFPDRREDGALTSGGPCVYHWGRASRPPRDRSSAANGNQEKVYSCCSETLGTSIGCERADSHVFKIYDGNRLASILQYERTPENPNVKCGTACCFDCEMSFTTFGLELVRLTVTAWPGGEELIDVLVRPLGQILDFNTRYSGIGPEHFAQAIPYHDTVAPAAATSDISPNIGSLGKPANSGTRLHVVDSPKAARTLLFTLLSPNTPLIGHSIENDLNVTRIVHPSMIDTALLFPHPGGLPLRRSLKALVKQILWRDIQTSGASGHDSKEDSRAAGDLVLEKVKRTWRSLQRGGWVLEGGKVKAPMGGNGKGATAAEDVSPGSITGNKRWHEGSSQT